MKSNFYIPSLSSFLAATFLFFLLINNSHAFDAVNLFNCDNINNQIPEPGVNCVYNGLPLCTAVNSMVAGNWLDDATPDPRVNCMDMVHLPLCSEFSSGEAKNKVNCINECNSGETHIVNDCVKFCHKAANNESCIMAKCHQLGGIEPKVGGADKNCEMEKCIKLTIEELRNSQFQPKHEKKYCEGQDNYCFEFKKDALKHLVTMGVNPMCKLHYCKPKTFLCGRDFLYDEANDFGDHVLHIEKKGADFYNEYKQYIPHPNSDNTNDLGLGCINKICLLPIIKRLECINGSPKNEDLPAAPVAKCNSNNKCLKATIDCFAKFSNPDECLLDCNQNNSPAQDCIYQPQCTNQSGSDSEKTFFSKVIDCNTGNNSQCNITLIDEADISSFNSYGFNTQSWFYRPSPHKKSFKNNLVPNATPSNRGARDAEDNELQQNGQNANFDNLPKNYSRYEQRYRTMLFDAKNSSVTNGNIDHLSDICYKKNDLIANDFGEDVPILGFYHDYVTYDTLVPQACTTGKHKMNGIRASRYEGLCGVNTIFDKLKREDQTAYFKDFVISDYENQVYKVTICVRFNNQLVPNKTCGKRECGISYIFGELSGNACGFDVCKELVIPMLNPKKCILKDEYGTAKDGSKMPDFTSSNTPEQKGDEGDNENCAAIIDDSLRVRAVKYGQYICAFLDGKDISDNIAGIFLSDNETIQSVSEEEDPDLKYCMTGDGNRVNIIDDTEDKEVDGVPNINIETIRSNCEADNSVDDVEKCKNEKILEQSCPNYYKMHKFKNDMLKWRPLIQIPYVDKSYYQKDVNKYMRKQLCAKIELKSGTRRSMTLADRENSLNLFAPPLFISQVYTEEGGSVSLPINNNDFGYTDFFNPSIRITLGDGSQSPKDEKIFSIPVGQSKSSTQTLTTTFAKNPYEKSVYIEKSYTVNSERALLCAYEDLGSEINPVKIGCVPRNSPEIGIILPNDKIDSGNTNKEKIIVVAKSDNMYNDAKILIQLQDQKGRRTTATEIPMLNAGERKCIFDHENYPICFEREACSKLNIERVKNEIDLINAIIAEESTVKFTEKRKEYDDLETTCNAKKGIIKTIDNSNDAYGWFNEVCIVEGFNRDLKFVVSKKINNGSIKGKCIIDTIVSSNECNEGGNPKKGCYCKQYNPSEPLKRNEQIRQMTPREAGLCIDIPLPKICPAISYVNENDNDYKESDPFYINHSLNKEVWENSNNPGAIPTAGQNYNGVHRSHYNRTQSPSHAEFNFAYEGSLQIGACNAFWRPNFNGLTIAQCSNGGTWNDNVTNPCIRYKCEEVLSGGDLDSKGEYPSIEFDFDETGEEKGARYGYSEWNTAFSGDFPTPVTPKKCITGFKTKNADIVANGIAIDKNNIDAIISASYAGSNGSITQYINGDAPIAYCNQIGQLLTNSIENKCQRIRCYIKDPLNNAAEWNRTGGAVFSRSRIIANVNTNQTNYDYGNDNLTQRDNNKPFPESDYPSSSYEFINASRNASEIMAESTITGECVNDLGFFQSSEKRPTMKCDHLGNWLPVENRCSTRCDEVTQKKHQDNGGDYSKGHGYALWNEIDNNLVGEIDGTNTNATSCLTGYIKYPYPPIRNEEGGYYNFTYNNNTLDIVIEHENYPGASEQKETYPLDINQDERWLNGYIRELPRRTCKAFYNTNTNEIKSAWLEPNSRCVNSCPGFDMDKRIGVGATIHPYNGAGFSANSNFITNTNIFGQNKIVVKWPSASFGEVVHRQYLDQINDHNTTHYFNGTNNNYFSLSRKCGANGVWEEPYVNCVARGEHSNSDNIIIRTINSEGRVPEEGYKGNSFTTPTTSSCRTDGFYYPTNTPSTSDASKYQLKKYTCQSQSVEKYINQYTFTHKPEGSGPNYNNACEKKCTGLAYTYNIGNQAVINTNSYNGRLYSNGHVLGGGNSSEIICPANYGTYKGASHATSDGSAKYCDVPSGNATYRSGTYPSIRCNVNNAQQQWVITNPCSRCDSCNLNNIADINNQFTCKEGLRNKWVFYFDQFKALSQDTSRGVPDIINHKGSDTVCRYHVGGGCGNTDNKDYRYTTRAYLTYVCTDGILNFTFTKPTNGTCEKFAYNGKEGCVNDNIAEECLFAGQCLDCHSTQGEYHCARPAMDEDSWDGDSLRTGRGYKNNTSIEDLFKQKSKAGLCD